MSSRPTELVEVALPVPLFQTFTYELSPDAERRPEAGSRVVVPFRNRKEIGICLGPATSTSKKLKRVIDVPDERPALSANMIALCKWMSEYYVVPVGLALRSALPAALAG